MDEKDEVPNSGLSKRSTLISDRAVLVGNNAIVFRWPKLNLYLAYISKEILLNLFISNEEKIKKSLQARDSITSNLSDFTHGKQKFLIFQNEPNNRLTPFPRVYTFE